MLWVWPKKIKIKNEADVENKLVVTRGKGLGDGKPFPPSARGRTRHFRPYNMGKKVWRRLQSTGEALKRRHSRRFNKKISPLSGREERGDG